MLSSVGSGLPGYLNYEYAAALREYGQPVFLPTCAGWVLERGIPGYAALDAMGSYPLFMCQDWSSLHLDLDMIKRDWISLSLVTDPFGDYNTEYLASCFPDVMVPFKQHYVVDLNKSAHSFVNEHHARNVRKAKKSVMTEVCSDPISFLDDWIKLYEVLIRRHQIHGIAAFSIDSFAQQLQVPGLKAFRAIAQGETVGMLLWYHIDKIAYYHLGAYSEAGYDSGASFALFSLSIEYFADAGLEWLNLGAGAGINSTEDDGLSRFKRGWSSGTRTAYFCGRIFDKTKYQEIASRRFDSQRTDYFPSYRFGEF